MKKIVFFLIFTSTFCFSQKSGTEIISHFKIDNYTPPKKVNFIFENHIEFKSYYKQFKRQFRKRKDYKNHSITLILRDSFKINSLLLPKNLKKHLINDNYDATCFFHLKKRTNNFVNLKDVKKMRNTTFKYIKELDFFLVDNTSQMIINKGELKIVSVNNLLFDKRTTKLINSLIFED